ncbi:hypothetical protein Tco_0477004, partial [Tanacetum coccineum]
DGARIPSKFNCEGCSEHSRAWELIEVHSIRVFSKARVKAKAQPRAFE